MIQSKSTTNTFSNILEEGNVLFEAGIIEGTLKLRLTVSESDENKKVYVGLVKSLEEHEKLHENFETLLQMFQWMSSTKNIKIDFNDTSVVCFGKLGAKIIEFGRILLKELELIKDEPYSLEDMIDQCSSKGELTNDEIKKNFQILANEVLELQKQQTGKNELVLKIDGLKEELLVKVSEQNEKVNKKYENLEQAYATEIVLLRKQIEEMNASNTIRSIDFEKFQKLVNEDSLNFQNTLKGKTDELSEEIRKLSQNIKENMKTVQSLKQKSSNQSEKVQNIKLGMNYLYQQNKKQMSKQKQQLKLEFYKNQKWANFYKFDGKSLTKVQGNIGYWYQFVFYEFVPFDKQFTFKVKIVKSSNRNIMIGIVDYEKQKQQQRSFISNNAICYRASNGQKHPSGKKEGNGVFVEETVQVRVDRRNKTIRWIVNNDQRAQYVHEMLGEENRNLLPYVEIYNVGDTIEYSL